MLVSSTNTNAFGPASKVYAALKGGDDNEEEVGEVEEEEEDDDDDDDGCLALNKTLRVLRKYPSAVSTSFVKARMENMKEMMEGLKVTSWMGKYSMPEGGTEKKVDIGERR